MVNYVLVQYHCINENYLVSFVHLLTVSFSVFRILKERLLGKVPFFFPLAPQS